MIGVRQPPRSHSNSERRLNDDIFLRQQRQSHDLICENTKCSRPGRAIPIAPTGCADVLQGLSQRLVPNAGREVMTASRRTKVPPDGMSRHGYLTPARSRPELVPCLPV